MKYVLMLPVLAVMIKSVFFIKFCFENDKRSAAVVMIVFVFIALALIISDNFL